MRTLTAAAQAEIAKKTGTKPVTIIDIQWTENGSIFVYGDVTDEVNGIDGRILEVTGVDNVITINGVLGATTGESSQISVSLDDRDGYLKNIFDNNDIHKRPVWVYQWYPNLDFSDRFLVFKGEVSSPIEWNEGDRTVRFDVLNKLEDAEIGFSVEEADIDNAPDDLIGKAWPLVFGTCIHVPALKLRQSFRGILVTGFGIHDFTTQCKLDQINKMCCPLIFDGWRTQRSPSPPFSVDLIATFVEEPGCKCRRFEQILQWELDLSTQRQFEYGTITVKDGDIFPQGVNLTLDICGATVNGRMNGTTFTVSSYVHPKVGELSCPEIKNWLGCTFGTNPTGRDGDLGSGVFTREGGGADVPPLFSINPDCGVDRGDRTNLGWDYLSTFPTADFFWAEPGCEVFLTNQQEVVYVANILPSTILRVAAYRTYDSGVRELTTVPTNLYTTRISNFNGYMVTEIVFTNEISHRGEGWEDEIYVSQTSSVGPNTVDIMEWIIDKYTDFSTDAASFAAVKTAIDNYPSHFPLLERRNVFEVLKDIAFQARCALYLRNDVFTLLYLADEPTADFTITEDDVMPKSLLLTHTPTEDLVTKMVCEWKYDHAIEDPNKIILRYNVKRYGTQEREYNWFIYNIHELVEKSATFWLIRLGNTWRRLQFSTPMTKLESEVYDVADVTLPDFSVNTIKCLTEKASFNSESHEMDFEMWTPVRAGSTEQFIFSWPANIEIDNIWPTLEDQIAGNAGGSGPNVNVKAPSLHVLEKPNQFKSASLKKSNCNKIGKGSAFEAASSSLIDGCRSDHGDKRPSDKDDQKPGVDVPGGEGEANPEGKNPTGGANCCRQTNEERKNQEEENTNDQTNRNRFSQDGDKKNTHGDENKPDGNPVEQLKCQENPQFCQVTCSWREQTINKVVLGGIKDMCGDNGIPIGATDHGKQTLTFDSLEAAIAACEAVTASLPAGTGYIVCNTYPIPGTIIVPLSEQSQWYGNNCEEPEEGKRQAISYCPSDANKSGENPGGSDIAQLALAAGLGAS